MALTRRLDGNSSGNLVTSAWWNTYYDLLTGAMTDQPVTIANTVKSTRQGSTSANTDLVQLQTTVSAARQYNLYIGPSSEFGVWDATGSAKVFTGTTTEFNVPGKYRWSKTLGGANQQVLNMTPTDTGAKNLALNYNSDNSVALYNYTDSITMLRVDATGNLSVPGSLTSVGSKVAATTGSTAVELGDTTRTTDTPYIDFHAAGGTNDYDVRLAATGGTSGTIGKGVLNVQGGDLQFNAVPLPTMTNKWGARRIFVQDTLPTTGMVKGDICIKTPFA